MAAPAMAQDAGTAPGITTAAAAEPAPVESGGEIVVTGSLIRNPNLVSATPVQAISDAEIIKRAPSTTEELLRSLPGVSPSVGSAVNNGANGVNTVDLRGLGSARNVVLLDGNRIVPTLANGATDLNTIPLALVQRVDVLTGGASTTYGADAVSGVVNFITRKDFSGVDMRASYRLPQRGDGVTKKVDLTIGGDFADGKGNAVISMGYTKIDPIYQTRGFAAYTVSGSNGQASGSSGTSTPTSIGFAQGTVQVSPDASSFQPYYQGYNFNPYNIFQTPIDRKSAYAQAHYDVADNIEVYGRGMFVQSTIKSIIAPSGVFGQALSINANNPYLNATKFAQLCAANAAQQLAAAAAGDAANLVTPGSVDPRTIAAYRADAARYAGATCATQTGTTLAVIPTYDKAGNPTNTGVVGNSITLPAVYRRSVELGPRISAYENNVYDARAGVRIGITSSINLDLGGSYGRSEQVQTQSGYMLLSRVQQALNATNTNTCINNTIGCVPINLFGQTGSITPAMLGFVSGQSSIRINYTLKQARALLTGDFGYTVPGAKDAISFALGSEYRRYGYSRLPDATAQNPTELGGAGGAILPFTGSYDVKEAYGEIIAPIMADKPGFQELTLEAGLRYSSYNIQAAGNPHFNATTYKAGATWAPVEGIRLRGNYQRAVRAPNIDELFRPVTTNLTTLAVDPCAGAAPTTNANLAAICVAQGAPASSIGAIQNPSSSQSNATGGGNVNIKPEKADTFTLGVVVNPREYVPGLSIAVDYYNIKVKNAIAQATPGDVISACFNNITAASATSLACTSIRRSPVNGRLSGPATIPGLPTPLTNNGRYATDGIDLTIDYTHKWGDIGLNLNFVGNWTDHLKFQAAPSSLDRECVGYYSANCGPVLGQIQPKWSWQERTGLTYDSVNFSVLWRHLGSMRYEPGLPPLFSGTITNAAGVSYSEAGTTHNFNKIKAYDYFDLTTQVEVKPHLLLTFNITNLFDKDAPIVSANAGTTTANSGNTFPSTYDAIGRTFSISARVTF